MLKHEIKVSNKEKFKWNINQKIIVHLKGDRDSFHKSLPLDLPVATKHIMQKSQKYQY